MRLADTDGVYKIPDGIGAHRELVDIKIPQELVGIKIPHGLEAGHTGHNELICLVDHKILTKPYQMIPDTPNHTG